MTVAQRTIRDWFAGQALQALETKEPAYYMEVDQRTGEGRQAIAGYTDLPAWQVAQRAYEIADAMVAERAKRLDNQQP